MDFHDERIIIKNFQNERMSEMEQIVWSDFIVIIVIFIAMGWFFWSVYIRNKKKGMMNEKSHLNHHPE